MANDESILREVDQELAEDRQWAEFQKNGPAIIGIAAAIVVGVAGFQIYSGQKESAAKAQALEFQNAMELLGEEPVQGRTALNAVAEEGGAYDDIARLHEAASYARGAERLKAIEIYQSLYNGSSTPKRIKEFARIKSAQLALEGGRDGVITELGDLTTQEGPFAVYARELEGLAALSAEDYETALSVFRALSIDFAAPEALRSRAEEFAALAEAGKAGVNITGRTSVDDIINAIGTSDAPASSPEMAPEALEVFGNGDEDDDHEGHDHGSENTDLVDETSTLVDGVTGEVSDTINEAAQDVNESVEAAGETE